MTRDANDILREQGEDALRVALDKNRRGPKPNGDSNRNFEPRQDGEPGGGSTAGKDQPPPLVFVTSGEFAASYVQPDYLLDGLFQRRFLYVLTGKTASGKTAVTLRLALCVSTGRPMGEIEVVPGRVLYLAGENPDDVKARWIAMCELEGLDPAAVPVDFVSGTFNIKERANELQAKAEAVGGYALVVVDTSAAFFHGKDENSNTELGDYARTVLRTVLVNLAGGPCVIANCHPVKNAADNNLLPRGGGAFLNEIDGNATLTADSGIAEMHWQGKWRGPDFEPVNFELQSVTLERLTDSRGRMHPTVVATVVSEGARKERKETAELDAVALLKLMADGKPRKQADAARELGWVSIGGQIQKSKASRVFKGLQKKKLLEEGARGYRLTAKGKCEIADIAA